MSSLECFRARLIDSRIENADQARFKKNKKKLVFPSFSYEYFCVFYTKYSYENSLEENPNVAPRERRYCHGSQSENSTDLDSSRRGSK